jgi:hypothetical protein
MLTIPASERAILTENGGLSKDAEGREVLIGLSYEESLHYCEYAYDRMTGSHRSSDTSNHYLKLREQHETARLRAQSGKD